MARKYYWLPTKRLRKNYRLATKKLTGIYWQPTKVENFNRQPTKQSNFNRQPTKQWNFNRQPTCDPPPHPQFRPSNSTSIEAIHTYFLFSYDGSHFAMSLEVSVLEKLIQSNAIWAKRFFVGFFHLALADGIWTNLANVWRDKMSPRYISCNLPRVVLKYKRSYFRMTGLVKGTNYNNYRLV